MNDRVITIVGGGLAGCEAAWQAAKENVRVILLEMKPVRFSPAHTATDLAELVCSNSFRAESLENAVGLLKEEMRRMGTLFMHAAEAARVPAGGALAVDRALFSAFITAALEKEANVSIAREEVLELPSRKPLIIASGPLTAPSLSNEIQNLVGEKHLYFYDAISPVVEAESVDMAIAFRASRYRHGDGAYINCPLNREEYYDFVGELVRATKVAPRDFEKAVFFEGCLPIEEMAARGKDTLAFGPLKPVGLQDPRTGKQPYAVAQLRPENNEGSLYNMVGFQTRLTWAEQKRVFRRIPGLGQARFERLGSCHRNMFISSPNLLLPTLQLKKDPGILFAGQITGVEGYVESAAMGMVAGISASRLITHKPFCPPPPTTAVGSLLHHITTANREHFQPMNVNYGLLAALPRPLRRKDRRNALAQRALGDLREWRKDLGRE